ncbi:MAG TPA: tetraacyldisaccharide 4'-kinase [Pirellulaceae bacterium]|nr:tetraacyldisaccharide 4'-kinase [Pirellulaceae bacterium]
MVAQSWVREILSGHRRGPLAAGLRGVLSVAESVYAWEVRRRNRWFDAGRMKSAEFEAPIISVGNLTVGGTGKTPLVLWLARWLNERGHQVTIISRGYGRKTTAPNDEALELAARLPGVPHVQNPNRVAAAREAIGRAFNASAAGGLENRPTHVLLLDDAFQHRRIARDLDIVLLDALEPFGYEHLLPRGLLREPVSSLARADVVALSRADAVAESLRSEIRERVESLAPHALWLELAHQPTALVACSGARQALASWRGRRVAAFCGIGNPAGFRHTLQSCGLGLAGFRELPDHFAYSPQAVSDLETWLRSLDQIAAAICTRKDLVKLPRATLAHVPLLALEVDLEIIRGQQALEDAAKAAIDRKLPPGGHPVAPDERSRG